MRMEVKLELGHKAYLKTVPTPEGFTHDWTVFVRGVNGIPIEHFVEKVVFYLHESFPKPKRTIKEPPFSVSESGYAGFLMPIEIHFRSKEEPKKVSFSYDMFLSLEGGVNNIRLEKMTFSNPVDEFREKLLRGGGTEAPVDDAGSQNADDSNKSTAAKKPKSALVGGKDTKPTKPPSPPSVSTKTVPKSASQPFTDIFGAPIRAKNSTDIPPKTKVPSHSKGKIAPTSAASVNSKEAKPSKEPEKPPKEKEAHSSSKEHRHIPKESHSSSSSKDPSQNNHKDPSRAKDPHRKELKKSSKDPSSKEVKPPTPKTTHSSKEERHHVSKEKESHHVSKEPKPPSKDTKEGHRVSKDSQQQSKEKHKKEGKHSKEVRPPTKEPPPPPKDPPKENHSSKEQQKVFKKPYPAKDLKEPHRSKTSQGSSKEVAPPKPAKEPATVKVETPTKLPVAKSSEKPPKKRSPEGSRPTHGQPEKKKKKPSTPPPEPSLPPIAPPMVKQEAKKPKQKGEDRSRADPHASASKKEKEKPRELPKPKPPSPPMPPPKSPSPAFDYGGYSSDSNDSKDSKKSTSVRAQYSSPASSISETSLDGSHPYTMNIKREIISPMISSDSEMSLSPPASPKHKSSSESPESRPVSRMSSESPSNSPKRRSSSDSRSSPRAKSPCSDSSSSSASHDSDSSDSDEDSPPSSKHYHDNELSNHKSPKQPSPYVAPPKSPMTIHYQEYLNNESQYSFKSRLDYKDFRRWREELMAIQKRIEHSDDLRLLQKIVDLIEETGNYELSPSTFDFDLCQLDISTMKKVKRLVNNHS